ncbi:reverse transcriptase domain-containing protein [Tanacetum coccineum]
MQIFVDEVLIFVPLSLNEGHNKLFNLLHRNFGYFFLEACGYDRHPKTYRETPIERKGGMLPVRQKKRGQATDRNQAIQEEVGKLVEAGIMKEVHYHDWLSNPVMVKKHDYSWRMCVDFKDLNKACPKDGYPLPEIDWKMPFGLRNAGETYQRLVDKAFHKQIGRNLEVNFYWTAEAEEAFKQMKQLIAELPMLTAPMEKEELIVYLAAAKETAIYIARSAKKRYFQAHPIIVITDQPIQEVLSRPEVAEEDSPNTPMEVKKLPGTKGFCLRRSSCTDGSGAGLILTNPEGMEILDVAIRFRFDTTNNEAEYEALIAGLRIAEQMGVKNLQANVDSRLVANQVNETYVAKEADMVRYLEKVKALIGGFKAFTIKQIPRSENKKADALSKIASTSFAHLSKQVLVEELKEKSISEVEVLTVVEEEGDIWMTPIYNYLAEETLPADMKKARAIKRKSWRFAVINGILYKKSFLGPWLRHTIRRGQGFADRLLLAYHAQRRKNVNKSMSRLSSS